MNCKKKNLNVLKTSKFNLFKKKKIFSTIGEISYPVGKLEKSRVLPTINQQLHKQQNK